MNYSSLVSIESTQNTITALQAKNINAILVNTKEEALQKVKELIPKGSSVYNGSSRTLEEIGLVAYLKGDTHGWNNLHAAVLAETDPERKKELGREALFAEYYVGSVHAISEQGQLVIVSASGSQLPYLTFTSSHIVLVVGTQKITPTLNDAIRRMREYVFPLENERMKSLGMAGSVISKLLIIEEEPAFMGRSFDIIFVNEKLGF